MTYEMIENKIEALNEEKSIIDIIKDDTNDAIKLIIVELSFNLLLIFTSLFYLILTYNSKKRK